MNIKFTKTHPKANMPHRANPTDFGADLTAVSMVITDDYIEYDTGIAIELPEGHAGLIMPRSSVSKYGLVLANSVGLIDFLYKSSIKLRFKVVSDSAKVYHIGDKIGQLVILPIPTPSFEEVDALDSTSRGGFGSTGV